MLKVDCALTGVQVLCKMAYTGFANLSSNINRMTSMESKKRAPYSRFSADVLQAYHKLCVDAPTMLGTKIKKKKKPGQEEDDDDEVDINKYCLYMETVDNSQVGGCLSVNSTCKPKDQIRAVNKQLSTLGMEDTHVELRRFVDSNSYSDGSGSSPDYHTPLPV